MLVMYLNRGACFGGCDACIHLYKHVYVCIRLFQNKMLIFKCRLLLGTAVIDHLLSM